MSLRIIDVDGSYTAEKATGGITFENSDGLTTVMQFNHVTGKCEVARENTSSLHASAIEQALTELKLAREQVVQLQSETVEAVQRDELIQLSARYRQSAEPALRPLGCGWQ